jgi:hypothetical protein
MDYSLYTDNATEYQKYLDGKGLPYHGPYGGDPAAQIYPKTETAAPHLLPFVVAYKDRGSFVKMDAAATTHGSGVTGFSDIQVVAKDVPKATEQYKILLGLDPVQTPSRPTALPPASNPARVRSPCGFPNSAF